MLAAVEEEMVVACKAIGGLTMPTRAWLAHDLEPVALHPFAEMSLSWSELFFGNSVKIQSQAKRLLF